MELLAFYIIVGYLMSLGFIGIGYWIGVNAGKTEDSDCQVSQEDMHNVLETLRLSASGYEVKVIDAIIDKIGDKNEA